jgi:hypothetical protein
MNKELLKDGLHREMKSNITYSVLHKDAFKLCSWVVMENITSDIYYYNEELKQKRPRFEIHPNLPKGINIEEPASTASEEQFLWRLYWGDVSNGDRKYFSQPPTMTWTDANGEKQIFSSITGQNPTPIPEDVIFPVEINMIVNFEIHMRYQPVGPGLEYRDIEFGGDTRMRM